VLISRDDQFLIPNGSIVLQANDRVLALARPEVHAQVAQLMEVANSAGLAGIG